MTLQAPRLTLMVVGRRNWILSSALGMNTNSVWVDECNWTGAKFAKTIRSETLLTFIERSRTVISKIWQFSLSVNRQLLAATASGQLVKQIMSPADYNLDSRSN